MQFNMILSKLNFIILFAIVISSQFNETYSLNPRKPKFGFDLYEMIRETFCEDICEISLLKKRTSRTIRLCIITCWKSSSTPLSSTTTKSSASITTSPSSVMSTTLVVTTSTTTSHPSTTESQAVIPLKSTESTTRSSSPKE